MIKKIIAILVLIIVVFHLSWYAASSMQVNKKVPDQATEQKAFADYLEKEKISVDLNSFKESYIEAHGQKLHLTIFSAGENEPTLVFIPGTSVYAKFYIEYMYKMYLQGFNVIGFDPRGHGLSNGLRGDYTISEIVDDTLAVVKYARQLFGGKVAIAGSSQGGIVAFNAAARDDSLAAAVCHNLADLNGRDNLILSHIRPPQSMVPLAEFLAGVYKSYAIPVSLYLDLAIEKSKSGKSLDELVQEDPVIVHWITIRALGSLMHTNLAKPVEKIKVPIMLIHSDKDSIFPQSYVENIFNKLTCEKKYLLLKNTQHLVLNKNVDVVVPPITKWLKEIM
ncbi:MAG: alpha/beta fold hydrolase [Syntrophaceae bacterium]|nr:alpha/beta fold hydrolase [Syntrophaceae bacterium]